MRVGSRWSKEGACWRLLEQVAGEKKTSLHFADFADGRGYSVARMLRRQGFEGRLRATGASGLDQVFYLKSCGFEEAALTEAEVALLKPIHLDPIPVTLQPAER